MSQNCPTNTTIITDNTPLTCEKYILDKCVIHSSAIAELGLPANSNHEEIINALVSAIIAVNIRISELENIIPT